MIEDVVLTDEQQRAYDGICNWIENPTQQIMSLGGLAGTGKTTLIKKIFDRFRAKSMSVCTATNKAVEVLEKKGVVAQTITKTFYNSIIDLVDGQKHVVGWMPKTKDELRTELIVVDEASMVGDRLFQLIQEYEIPILLVGDHGQLPPVKDKFSSRLTNPVFKLETPLRQALNNPILRLAHDVRKKDIDRIDFTKYAPNVIYDEDLSDDMYTVDQIICASNSTRVSLNQMVRERLFNTEYDAPVVGDKVISLENRTINQRSIRNGQQFIIRSINFDTGNELIAVSVLESLSDGTYHMNVPLDLLSFNNFEYQKEKRDNEGGYNIEQKEISMDFGYAITCYKAQGSEWNNVMVAFEDWPREPNFRMKHFYTAFTRAKENLVIADIR